MIGARRLSIRHYAVIFAGLTLAMLMLFGTLAYQEVHEVRENVAMVSHSAAHRELSDGLDKVIGEAIAMTNWLGDRDDARQQIQDPANYIFWHHHLLSRDNSLPYEVIDLELYRSDGSALTRPRETLLPHKVAGSRKQEPYIDLNGDTPALILIQEILDKSGTGERTGFIGLHIDFMRLLQRLSQFQHLDSRSVEFAPSPDGLLLLEDFFQSTTFQARHNPATETVENVLGSAILRLGLIIGTLSLLFYPMLVYLVGKPLRQLSHHIDHLKDSSGGVLLDPLKHHLPVKELEKVRVSLNEYQSELQNVHSSLDEKNRELWNQAHHDALTGVMNRRAFDDFWRSLNEILVDRRLGICLILFDVNHFKAINDTYGHQVGDEVLKGIASCISNVLRKGEHLYRLGGDELATVLIDCQKESALNLANRCEEAIANHPFSKLGIREPVRVSIGLAQANAASDDELATLPWKADIAMYSAKKPGLSNVVFYNEDMAKESGSLLSSWINNAVFEAINEGTGLTIFYQPIVDLERDEVVYYEALIRIHHDDEWILPGSIFPLVEARRLEIDMDRAILKRILEDLDDGCIPEGSGVSINLSGPMVVSDKVLELLAPFQAYMDDYRFTLEITETALITQLGTATENLDRLRAMGFIIALDDFGSGYSSMRYLANMPVDLVKFDISLIRSLNDLAQQAIVQHLAQMINESGYRLVAEGIESETLREQVTQLGFHYGQGYLFGRPEQLLPAPVPARASI
ncbi:MAG: bifunctional diguanylate cyclase/phosphodiesterase [Sedimenticola sp.]